MSASVPPLALYVHLPWCVRKCPYCDFNSHAVTRSVSTTASTLVSASLDAQLEQDYVQALLQDLAWELQAFPELRQRPLVSIFFGGGTPSLLSPKAYTDFLQGLRQHLSLQANCEITLEANPGAVEQSRFAGYLAAGINRLSVGVQSFQTPQLQALGRIHSGQDAVQAVQAAQQAGFTNINLDLMHGLPGQDVAAALADLHQALDLQPAHLSWYQLTLEPNTLFYKQPPLLPVEDLLADIQDAGQAVLEQAGWEHYEVSAYARPGMQAQHNLNYWQFGDYLGLGAGAHGKISYRDAQQQLIVTRRWKTRQPQAYLSRVLEGRDMLAGSSKLQAQELPLEFMLNALRLKNGVAASLYPQRTGLNLASLEPAIHHLTQQGLWSGAHKRLACSSLGWRWLNKVLEQFMQN